VVRSTSRLYVILVYHLPSLFVGPIEAYGGADLAKHWYMPKIYQTYVDHSI